MAGNKKIRSSKGQGIHHTNIKNQKVFLKRLRAAFRKIVVCLKLEHTNEELEATLVLTEMDGKSAYLLSPKKIKKNKTLLFTIKQPLSFEIRSVVRYCEAIEGVSSYQVGNEKKSFRTYIEFIFSTELEKQAMVDIYNKIRDENYVPTQWHIFITEQIHQRQMNISPSDTQLFSENDDKKNKKKAA